MSECSRCNDDALFYFTGDGGFFYACGDNDCLLYAEQSAKLNLETERDS